MNTSTPENKDTLPGFFYALSAYIIWGFLPFFMKAVAHIPPTEVIAHRVIWSIPIAAGVLLWQGRTADLMRALKTPSMLAMAVVTASLVSVNWLIYVWSIGAGHALDAALGYYINPLFSVLLGFVVLKEKISRIQAIAIGLAVLAVGVLTYDAGRLPLVALGLSVSWGIYAYFKKSLPIGPNQGFLLEVLILAPIALAYLIYLASTGAAHFATGPASDTWLLAATGLITAVPLMLYANGAKLLRLSTIGVMQYIPPTMIFLTAVFVFGEPFGTAKLVAFCMIWTALALYSYSFFAQRRAG
jgi:chloramphenicol-sensitive protein RarD